MVEPSHLPRKLLLDVAVWDGAGRLLLGEQEPLSSGMTTLYIITCILLVIFSGMMAGLTLGLLSLDRYVLFSRGS